MKVRAFKYDYYYWMWVFVTLVALHCCQVLVVVVVVVVQQWGIRIAIHLSLGFTYLALPLCNWESLYGAILLPETQVVFYGVALYWLL
jgi:hypothetical protein